MEYVTRAIVDRAAIWRGLLTTGMVLLFACPQIANGQQPVRLDTTAQVMLYQAELRLAQADPAAAVNYYNKLFSYQFRLHISTTGKMPIIPGREALTNHSFPAYDSQGRPRTSPTGTYPGQTPNSHPSATHNPFALQGATPPPPRGEDRSFKWQINDVAATPISVLPYEAVVGAAIAYQQLGYYSIARLLYLKSFEYHLYRSDPTVTADWPTREIYEGLGDCYNTLNQYEEALKAYGNALKVEDPGKTRRQAKREPARKITCSADWGLLQKIGEMELAMGRCADALDHFRSALRLCRLADADRSNPRASLAFHLTDFASVYIEMGHYDNALSCLNVAVAHDMENRQYERAVKNMIRGGEIYREWGDYGTSMAIQRQAYLTVETHLPRDFSLLADLRCEMGNSLMGKNNFAAALQEFQVAAQLLDKVSVGPTRIDRMGGPVDANLTNPVGQDRTMYLAGRTGAALIGLGEYEKARKKLSSAVKELQRMGKSQDSLPLIVSQGQLAYLEGRANEALSILAAGLQTAVAQDRAAIQPNFHRSMATIRQRAGDSSGAISHYSAAIAVIEKLRRTARGALRRSYLASQIDVYQSLAETYVSAANPGGALGAVELASAKYLIDQLENGDDPDGSAGQRDTQLLDVLYDQSRSSGAAGNTGKTTDPMADARAAQELLAQLPAGTAIVRYANTARDRMIVFVITSSGVSAVAVETGNRAAQAPGTTAAAPVFTDESSTRGLQRIERGRETEVDVSSLARAIRSHRNALAGQLGMAPGGATGELGKSGEALYRCLIAPVEAQLDGVSSLWIVPDGALALLPFESLVLPDGRYLVEAYDIRYVQSLRVAQILRNRTYDQPRKSLLAFGGAIYEKEKDSSRETGKPSGDRGQNAWDMALAVTASRSPRQGEWKNLPGTLVEVEALGALYQDSRVLTGAAAAESSLKAMAAAGELANYRVLHFATHGMVVPDSPELSALVLSQTEPAGAGSEDGFLSMQEVVKLRLTADLVTLSACETGLGKIYSGEGVVGLGQAFLVAGANGVTLSLWQVADESTKDFMVAVYGLVEREGIPFAQALTRVKREFIKDRRHSHPFYWAPFVYYGQ